MDPRPTWNQLWRRLRRIAGYVPLTPAGLVLVLGLFFAIRYRGMAQLDLVALAAGVGLAVVLVLGIAAVILGTFWVRRRLETEEHPSYLELTSGKQVHSGFALKFPWYVPLVRLHWTVEGFAAEVEVKAQGGRLRELLTCHRRGLAQGLSRRFTVTDTLGLSAISWDQDFSGGIRVLPYRGRLEQPNILLSMVSGEDLSDPRGDPEGDRIDMRQYQKGDPMKFILWKVYSRSGKVMVRVPERALAARPRSCCYLISGQEDEASAALARVLLELRMLGDEWRFGADGTSGYATQKQPALDMVARSGNHTRSDSRALNQFMTDAEKEGYGFCLILAPPGSKELAEEITRCAHHSRMNCDIWVGMDIKPQAEGTWLRALQALEPEGTSARTVHQYWGGRATLVERASGQVMVRTQ